VASRSEDGWGAAGGSGGCGNATSSEPSNPSSDADFVRATFSHAPRSATILAEIDSVLYVLRAAAFDDIKAHHPGLSQKLLVYFVSVMAERLTFASRTIAVLRR
jgi:hypothetical protein